MRLSKIKLAGFKSFVDPTTVPFPSNLVGVVGPNGCGKSNVIDAIRWVMGESSASRLRGDSITDVIFNGSSSRKPIGAASVELLFDNAETTLEGQYARYAEIAIRREVSRDGISAYYLNGTRCRRKDITGIFLGTGLGPRSYSIIDQGMISRIIEAKPEEMRVFVEEAAGISKYKERRKETSTRIRRTRENLDRLMDVLDEVEKQIKHLDRQAKSAERYARYKAEERRTAAELLALRLHDLDQQAQQSNARLNEKETALQAVIAEQRGVEAQIEDSRVRQSEMSENLSAVQARYYRSGSEIARLEQSIAHAEELRERQRQDLAQAIEGAQEISGHINKDQSEIAQLELSLSELVPGLEQAKQAEQRSTESLARAERALADWQSQWDEYTLNANDAQQTLNVEQTRTEQLESRIRSLAERRDRLVQARTQASPDDLKDKFEKLALQEQRQRQSRDEFDRALTDVGGKIRKMREQDQKLTRLADERRATLQAAEAKYASLEAVQKASLGESNEIVKNWLESTGLMNHERVAQSLEVQEGWERAVETVLGDYLQAVCVSDVDTAARSLAQLGEGKVTLLLEGSSTGPGESSESSLAARVTRAPAAVMEILRSVRVAESLDRALAIRDRLGDAGSVITADGVWLSHDWLRVARDKDARAGLLGREHDMRRLKAEIRELQARTDSAKGLIGDGRARLSHFEARREKMQRDAASLLSEYSEVKAALESAKYRMDQTNARQAAITEESGDIETERGAAEEQLRASRSEVARATEVLTALQLQKTNMQTQRQQLRDELARVREQSDQDRQAAQEMAIQFESRRTSKDSAAQGLARMESQLAQFGTRGQEIREQLEAGEAPLAESKRELELQLDVRVAVENEMSEARKRVETVEHELREFDQQRMRIDQRAEEARGAVSDARMGLHEVRVRREGFAEQLDQTDFELPLLLDEMDEAAEPGSWEEKLEKIRRRIDRLGPINLAAIDEFKEQSARKEYLDSQLEDLNKALATLEGAIRKIDRETRTRFRETFANVDTGFKRLFPKLFAGGHAYLELTGDDLLTAGVTVMARPPGKRNSTIHLLSGGEKALTAVALVFAIFELNPAPFCLLDEVDAPLDDANVARFCDIVREMSEKVQFVFITHNKVTMEMARQLTGVTMQEPGVSRLVAVDLDEAVKMAAS